MGQALGCIQVDQSTVAIKESFGKFDEVLEPGCHCLPWCFGRQVAGHLSLRVQQLDVRCETKTKVCWLVIKLNWIELTTWKFGRNMIFYQSHSMGGIMNFLYEFYRITILMMLKQLVRKQWCILIASFR